MRKKTPNLNLKHLKIDPEDIEINLRIKPKPVIDHKLKNHLGTNFKAMLKYNYSCYSLLMLEQSYYFQWRYTFRICPNTNVA